jgi:hypothetical protein
MGPGRGSDNHGRENGVCDVGGDEPMNLAEPNAGFLSWLPPAHAAWRICMGVLVRLRFNFEIKGGVL